MARSTSTMATLQTRASTRSIRRQKRYMFLLHDIVSSNIAIASLSLSFPKLKVVTLGELPHPPSAAAVAAVLRLAGAQVVKWPLAPGEPLPDFAIIAPVPECDQGNRSLFAKRSSSDVSSRYRFVQQRQSWNKEASLVVLRKPSPTSSHTRSLLHSSSICLRPFSELKSDFHYDLALQRLLFSHQWLRSLAAVSGGVICTCYT